MDTSRKIGSHFSGCIFAFSIFIALDVSVFGGVVFGTAAAKLDCSWRKISSFKKAGVGAAFFRWAAGSFLMFCVSSDFMCQRAGKPVYRILQRVYAGMEEQLLGAFGKL